LLITEEVLRHLVIRDERKGAAALRDDVIDGIAAASLDEDEIQAAAAASEFAANAE
jgi:hypothetical protein